MADINVIVLPDGTEYPVSDYYLPVAISNPTDGQVLKYDAANEVWYNGTGGGGGASSIEDLDDVNITTPTDGQVLKYDATGEEWKNVTLQESDVSGLTDDLDTLGGGENIVDKVPYISRISGGDINSSDINIGNRELDKIIGGTFAFNQRNVNSNWAHQGGTKVYDSTTDTVTFTPDAIGNVKGLYYNNLVLGHKNLIMCFINPAYNCIFAIGENNKQVIRNTIANTWNLVTTITNNAVQSAPTIYAQLASSGWTTIGNILIKNIMIIDLTQMFGSTIADYIYSLEQATAGAGVSWFRNLFPKDYYAYNAGELMSVKTSAHKTVGKNLLSFSTTTITSQTIIINNLFLKSGDYTFSIDVNNTTNIAGVFTIRIDTTALATAGFTGNYKGRITKSFTLLQDSIINIVLGGASAGYSFTVSNAQIEFGSTATTYEPYSEHNYPLDTNLELRGIPKLDSNNKLYYDGDTYSSDGAVTRKYGIVDLGTLDWGFSSTIKQFYSSEISDGKKGLFLVAIMDGSYVYDNRDYANYPTPHLRGVGGGSDSRVYIVDDRYENATAFKTAMNGVYLVYELAIPTSELAKPYQNPQIVDDLGMEEYIDERSVPIPVGHETTYLRNLKEKLEDAPAIPVVNGDYVLRKTDGGTEYVEAVHYSTDEHVIGTWIDGKTIYEKTYTFTAPSSNAFAREDLGIPMSGISNAWIDIQNTFATNSTMCTNPTFYDGSPKADQFGCYLNFLQTNLAFDYRVGSDFYSSNIVLTIRYTKSS